MLTEWIVPPKLREFICVNLCLSACICGKKKIISLVWDDKELTLMHAEVEKRDRNNSDANRMEPATEIERIHLR
jgi:hypothetical protein